MTFPTAEIIHSNGIDLEVFSNQHDARLSVQSPASLFSAELTAVDVSNP
jgi:hypothetical protein